MNFPKSGDKAVHVGIVDNIKASNKSSYFVGKVTAKALCGVDFVG